MGYQPIEHIDFDSLSISEHTGLPYDPELIEYLGPNHARPRRKFKLFRRREKPQPKQEHVSLFEVLPNGHYAGCERCYEYLKTFPVLHQHNILTDVFYEKEKGHRYCWQGVRRDGIVGIGLVDRRLISNDAR